MTLTDLVSNTLRVCRERGEVLTVGTVYSVVRDHVSAQCGTCAGSAHPYSGEPAGVLRVELRDGTSPGEAVLHLIDDRNRRVVRFTVPTCLDFDAKEAIEEALAEFAAQTARAAA